MKKRVIGGAWELFKSFSALNVVLLLGLVAFLGYRGQLTPEYAKAVIELFKEKEAPPEEAAPPPDLAVWQELETNEEREAFLEEAYQRLQEDRARVRREMEAVEKRMAGSRASLADLNAQVEKRRAGLEEKERFFAAREKEWEKDRDDEAFAAQMAIYAGVKEDVLAKQLLSLRGEEGDWFIVRVLRAMTETNPRKAAKLATALQEDEMGGEQRLNRVFEMWRKADVPESLLETAKAETEQVETR